MSHPLETSMSSRELAEHIDKLWWATLTEKGSGNMNGFILRAAALIDTWVRVREGIAELRTHVATCNVCFHETECGARRKYESALATARKQLEGSI